MNIDDMPAGPELDRMVAEKVMGWHADKRGIWWLDASGNRCGTQEFPAALPAIVGTKVIDGQACTDGGRRCVFRPSTNIAHAWEVVEKMTAGDFTCEMWFAGTKGWGCAIGKRTPTPTYIPHAYAPTAPLAICRAALKAVGSPSA